MASTPIMSWNVQGVNDPLKRTMISTVMRRIHPAIIGLQETHLQDNTVSFLQYAWVGKAYHSTYSAFSRGVSVLIHKAIAYQELDSLIDISGRFIFLHCKIYTNYHDSGIYLHTTPVLAGSVATTGFICD